MGPSPDTKIHHRSYWLDGVRDVPATGGELPRRTDVLVIGSGYTGLNAARVTAAGGRDTLVLDAGDFDANYRDSANHPKGVWELPPTLGTKREELREIGESDRMTLLFRKR